MELSRESQASQEEMDEKYQDIVKCLEKSIGLTQRDHLYFYEGFWYDSAFLVGTMSSQEHFVARPTDIVLSSPLKSGTTWLKALAFATVTRTHYHISESPLLTNSPQVVVPYLEFNLSRGGTRKELPLLSTHIPYKSLPKSIIDSKCKIVYIYRDPKDAFVSLWHFMSKLLPQGKEPLPLDEACGMFLKGRFTSGPYWDHVLGYLQARMEMSDKIFVLKYEDLVIDTAYYVKEMAEFMGYPFTLEEEKEGLVQEIIRLCSFENLCNLEVNKNGKHRPNGTQEVENSSFFRKGQVGDWRNHMNAEMANKIDQIMKEKFNNCGFTFISKA